jgi:hypothetical protein
MDIFHGIQIPFVINAFAGEPWKIFSGKHLWHFPRGYLKRRKYRLFLQAQRDFALKSLGIHKGFQGSLT